MSGIKNTVFSSLLPHLLLYSSLLSFLIFSSILFFSPTSSSPLFFSSFLPYLLLYFSFLFSFISSSPLPNLLLFSFIILTLILYSLFDHSTLLSSFTFSGTTGNPKGVELSHKNLISNVKGLNKRWKVHTSRLSKQFLNSWTSLILLFFRKKLTNFCFFVKVLLCHFISFSLSLHLSISFSLSPSPSHTHYLSPSHTHSLSLSLTCGLLGILKT